jgi:hypothetical protein
LLLVDTPAVRSFWTWESTIPFKGYAPENFEHWMMTNETRRHTTQSVFHRTEGQQIILSRQYITYKSTGAKV